MGIFRAAYHSSDAQKTAYSLDAYSPGAYSPNCPELGMFLGIVPG